MDQARTGRRRALRRLARWAGGLAATHLGAALGAAVPTSGRPPHGLQRAPPWFRADASERALLAERRPVRTEPPARRHDPVNLKRIAASGEAVPVVGMGTWLTFDVAGDEAALARRREVLRAFFAGGGALIDSSPMYGSAEEVLGLLLPQVLPSAYSSDRIDAPDRADRARAQAAVRLFAATKVWTIGQGAGDGQMRRSLRRWGLERFDLMQVHNLLDWRTHLPTLRLWRAEGRIRYVGVTTSHGRRHGELEALLRSEHVDFAQFTYNVLDREAEQRLLPMALERGVAVIANRPFDGGALFDRVRGRPLPAWAAEFGCHSWAQFFLQFVASHPAVTCVIPATRRADHMAENMRANVAPLPDAAQRARMVRWLEAR